MRCEPQIWLLIRQCAGRPHASRSNCEAIPIRVKTFNLRTVIIAKASNPSQSSDQRSNLAWCRPWWASEAKSVYGVRSGEDLPGPAMRRLVNSLYESAAVERCVRLSRIKERKQPGHQRSYSCWHLRGPPWDRPLRLREWAHGSDRGLARSEQT